MRKGGQKQKANAYERSVAEIFTKMYYPTGDGEFRRIPLSGGWDKRAMPGDLVPLRFVDKDTEEMTIDKTFPMTIECKIWKDIKHFFSGLYSSESQLFDWMAQAWEDALIAKKIPVVVFRLFRVENIVMLISTDFNSLTNYFGNFTGKIYSIEKTMLREQQSYKEKKVKRSEGEITFLMHQKLVFILLKDFLEWIDWEFFKSEKNTGAIQGIL